MKSDITVMSSNVCCWGNDENTIPNRMPRVREIYKKYFPDIIGTQETTKTWKGFFINEFPEYFIVGEPREDIPDPEHTVIMIKKERFELLETKTFALSESREFGSLGWGEKYPRICTYAVLKDKLSEKEIAVFNTHLALNEGAREEMLKLIFAEIRKLNLPTVLTGDFNTAEGTPCYSLCIEGLFDDSRICAKDRDSGITYTGYDLTVTPERYGNMAIDYCLFTKGDFEAESYKIIRERVSGHPISDHYPVLAKLKLK